MCPVHNITLITVHSLARRTQVAKTDVDLKTKRTYFCGAVDVFDRKHDPQSVEENLCESRYELCCGHQDVHAVWPVIENDNEESLVFVTQNALGGLVVTQY